MNITFDPLGIFERIGKINWHLQTSSLIHWGILIFLAIYFIFTLLIYRQVSMMNSFLGTKLSPFIRTFALLYILYTLLVIIGILAL